MKASIVSLVNGALALNPGWTEFSMNHDNYERRVRVFVPENFDHEQAIGHLVIHGLNDRCELFCSNYPAVIDHHSQHSRLDETLSHGAKNHLIICPCSLEKGGIFGFTAWNSGACCRRKNDVNDVDFVLQTVKMAASLISPLDPSNSSSPLPFKEFYSTGFSNGGMMTAALACRYPDLMDSAQMVNAVSALARGKKGHLECARLYKERVEAIQSGSEKPLRTEKKGGKLNLFKFSVYRKNAAFDMAFPYFGNLVPGFVSVPSDDLFFRRLLGCEARMGDNNRVPLVQFRETPITGWSFKNWGCRQLKRRASNTPLEVELDRLSMLISELEVEARLEEEDLTLAQRRAILDFRKKMLFTSHLRAVQEDSVSSIEEIGEGLFMSASDFAKQANNPPAELGSVVLQEDDPTDEPIVFRQVFNRIGMHRWHHQSVKPWEDGYDETLDREGFYGHDDSAEVLRFIEETNARAALKTNTREAIERV